MWCVAFTAIRCKYFNKNGDIEFLKRNGNDTQLPVFTVLPRALLETMTRKCQSALRVLREQGDLRRFHMQPNLLLLIVGALRLHEIVLLLFLGPFLFRPFAVKCRHKSFKVPGFLLQSSSVRVTDPTSQFLSNDCVDDHCNEWRSQPSVLTMHLHRQPSPVSLSNQFMLSYKKMSICFFSDYQEASPASSRTSSADSRSNTLFLLTWICNRNLESRSQLTRSDANHSSAFDHRAFIGEWWRPYFVYGDSEAGMDL